MMVYKIFDSQNLLFIGLQISPQIFSILQNFPINNLKAQQWRPLAKILGVAWVLHTCSQVAHLIVQP